jgi:putative multicomponent Na+:H+ antiporter subunit B
VAAALLYALLGAPDVAVTEVLVGALLVTLLYVVIFKRTREIRVGVTEARCFEGRACHTLTAFCTDRGFRERNIFFPDEIALMKALDESLIDVAFLDHTPEGFVSIPADAVAGLPRVVVPREAWDLIEVLDVEEMENS